jgi:hypothetical protein
VVLDIGNIFNFLALIFPERLQLLLKLLLLLLLLLMNMLISKLTLSSSTLTSGLHAPD